MSSAPWAQCYVAKDDNHVLPTRDRGQHGSVTIFLKSLHFKRKKSRKKKKLLSDTWFPFIKEAFHQNGGSPP